MLSESLVSLTRTARKRETRPLESPTGLISAGARAETATFIGVFTLGEAPGGSLVMQFSAYRLGACVWARPSEKDPELLGSQKGKSTRP